MVFEHSDSLGILIGGISGLQGYKVKRNIKKAMGD
jgi:hypothetical protein